MIMIIIIAIVKVLDFKEQGITNKDTKFSLFKVIWKYLRSTEVETPEGKAIFGKLEKFFQNQIYQQKNKQSEIQHFAASFNKKNNKKTKQKKTNKQKKR